MSLISIVITLLIMNMTFFALDLWMRALPHIYQARSRYRYGRMIAFFDPNAQKEGAGQDLTMKVSGY